MLKLVCVVLETMVETCHTLIYTRLSVFHMEGVDQEWVLLECELQNVIIDT